MSITVPQMFLLSHAMWANHERADRRFKRKHDEEEAEAEIPTFNGKPLSECNSEEMAHYYGGWN